MAEGQQPQDLVRRKGEPQRELMGGGGIPNCGSQEGVNVPREGAASQSNILVTKPSDNSGQRGPTREEGGNREVAARVFPLWRVRGGAVLASEETP